MEIKNSTAIKLDGLLTLIFAIKNANCKLKESSHVFQTSPNFCTFGTNKGFFALTLFIFSLVIEVGPLWFAFEYGSYCVPFLLFVSLEAFEWS